MAQEVLPRTGESRWLAAREQYLAQLLLQRADPLADGGLGQVHGLGSLLEATFTRHHGQGLEQHNDPYHAVNIYEESVRVPLMMRWPGKLRPGRRTLPVEQVDVLPTILGALGIEAPGEIDGLDVGVGGRGNEDKDLASRTVFLYRQFYTPGRKLRKGVLSGEQFAVRLEDWKLIVAEDERRWELYDLPLI